MRHRLRVFLALASFPVLLRATPFSVYTHNHFLLPEDPVAARDMPQRIQRLARRAGSIRPDVVVLTEVWGARNRRLVLDAFAAEGYSNHAHFDPTPVMTIPRTIELTSAVAMNAFHTRFRHCTEAVIPRPVSRRRFAALTLASGVGWFLGHEIDAKIRDYGNGLLILSRNGLPMHPEGLRGMSFVNGNGTPESWVYKGALSTLVSVPNVGWVRIYGAHAVSQNFDMGLGELFGPHMPANERQLRELARWIASEEARRQPAGYSGLYFFAGDLNQSYYAIRGFNRCSDPVVPGYQQLTGNGRGQLGLVDAVRAYRAMRQGNGSGDEPELTYDPANHLVAERLGIAPGDYSAYPGEVLDYVMARGTPRIRLLSARVVQEQWPFDSDHNGVIAYYDVR